MKGKDLKRLKEITENIHMLGFEAVLHSWKDNQEERITILGEELQKTSNELHAILINYSVIKNLRYQIRHNTRENKY